MMFNDSSDNYSPKPKIELELIEIKHIPTLRIELTKEECNHLMNFFYSIGYISHEFHEPIHDLIKRIKEFIK